MQHEHQPEAPDHAAAEPLPDPAGCGADVWPRRARPAGGAPRRSVLRAAGAGLAGVLGVGVAGAAAGGVHYRDVAAARRRGDASTIAPMTSATSLNVLWRANTDRKVMALTFDDGPGDKLTAPLLDALREARVRATFALVGERAAERAGLVREQVAGGHELVNHSWSHADLSRLAYDDVARELERTDDLLHQLTGRRPTVIRPPWGRVSGALLQHAAQAGQRIVLWDVRLRESELDTRGNAEHVLSHLRPGTVLLAHDAGLANRYIGIAAIPEIIRGAKAKGYEFLTASEMFDVDAAG